MRCGYVTKEAAEKYYGAVFWPETSKLDAAATKARRAEMRAQGLPHDEPIADTGVPVPAPAHAVIPTTTRTRSSSRRSASLAAVSRAVLLLERLHRSNRGIEGEDYAPLTRPTRSIQQRASLRIAVTIDRPWSKRCS